MKPEDEIETIFDIRPEKLTVLPRDVFVIITEALTATCSCNGKELLEYHFNRILAELEKEKKKSKKWNYDEGIQFAIDLIKRETKTCQK